jgi:hypothetical protein
MRPFHPTKACILVLTLALGFLSPSRAAAGFLMVSSSASVNANDSASWTSSGTSLTFNPVSTVFGVNLHWSETDHSNPITNTLVKSVGPNSLFIGTAVTGTVDTASFDFQLSFNSSSPNVYGVGFNGPKTASTVGGGGQNPSIQLIATDVFGNSKTFDLGTGVTGYLGVVSDTPLPKWKSRTATQEMAAPVPRSFSVST